MRALMMMRFMVLTRSERRIRRTTGQVDVDPALVLLRVEVQALFATDALNTRLYLLDVVRGMDAFADDSIPLATRPNPPRRKMHSHMQMSLTMPLRVFNPLLQNLLRLLDKLTMKINRISRNPPFGVILAEDKLGRLLIVLVHLAPVIFALVGEFFGARAVAAGVGILGLCCALVGVRLIGMK